MVQPRPTAKTRRRLRTDKRHLKLETLERRELLAAEVMADFPAAHAIFAPGTSQDYVDEWESRHGHTLQNRGGGGSGSENLGQEVNLAGSRWTNPTGGPSPNLGDGATISWSIVPDGTGIAGPAAPAFSDLVQFLDGIYGGGGDTIEARPWFNLFERAFDGWAEISGLTFVYEPSDDGAAQEPIARGETGVRGDFRIAGAVVDGPFNVLAYNFLPGGGGNNGIDGDMVIDTADTFYALQADAATGENRALINILMHEIGHGLGLLHVEPINETKLMEPFISLAYLGPQHDDILAVQSLYGDRFTDNDTFETATELGPLVDQPLVVEQVSIDANTDADWFTFDAEAGQLLTLSVAPQGEQYLIAPQAIGGGPPLPRVPIDTTMISDLSFELFGPDGTLIGTGDAAGLGDPEFVAALPLTQSGAYTVGIIGNSLLGPTIGTSTETQLYTLSIQQSDLFDPSLIAVAPNNSDLFDLDPTDFAANLRTTAPNELVMTFGGTHPIDPSTLDAISIQYSESGNFAQDAVDVTIGFIGLDDNGRNATLRFAENLADGFYQLSITTELTSTFGIPFFPVNPEPVPGNALLTREVVSFEIELGAKVTAVVPQPIVGGVQSDNTIDVFFDDADLFRPGSTVGDASFYQLIDTQNTATTEDDVITLPASVTVDAVGRKVTLTFPAALDTFVGDADSLRLRVGDNSDFTSVSVVAHSPAAEPGLTAALANVIPVAPGGNWSTVVIGQEISNSSALILPMVDNAGAQNEPGHRDFEVENHFFFPGGRDVDNAVSRIEYTFLRNESYGTNSQGDPLFNQMNPEQEKRFLEVLDIYATALGIDFIETENSGLRLIVGDLSTADPTTASGPGGTAGLGGPGGVTMDAFDFQDANSNLFGAGFFEVALHEVGHSIGLGHTFELPPGTIQGSTGELPDTNRIGPGTEWAFPGESDLVHAIHLHQRESLDVDLYRVDVAEEGVLKTQTFAQRLPDASLLDTRLALYRQDSAGQLQLLSSNEDYFGADSYIEFSVQPGTYFVAVSSEGNSAFNPNLGLVAEGGTSEGSYELRVDFTSESATSMVDSAGSRLDGDRDGVQGGNYDFWFEPASANTIYVNKAGGTGGGLLGSITNPFTTIPAALSAAQSAIAAGVDGVVVRLMANGGLDGDVATEADNLAFEIGIIASINDTLDDGRNLDLPSGVHLVVDGGVVMKFLDARISVGSDDDGNDRSEGTISVQGTPELPVYFTSYNNTAIGSNSNPLGSPVRSGDWGGIEIRSDVDRLQGRIDPERDGIFQNYINHAEISFGGGQVSTIGRTVDPIHLSSARPELSYNTITQSSGAAISADPNTFAVTTFTEPRFQRSSISGDGFVTDYERLGPAIDSNTLLNNSTNGIFVRIDTPAGGGLETLSVTARLDDTDIVHVLGENLLIEGSAGGPIEESRRPSAILGVTPLASGGALLAGDYRYSYTFVDAFGFESPGSLPQAANGVAAGGSVRLTNIPVASGRYVARRLYRSVGSGPFELIADLDRSSRDFVDTSGSPAADAPIMDPTDTAVVHGRIDGTLIVDPGALIKNQGARIQLGFGATVIAEGVEGKEVIFTSRSDDRYGAGGTFDTNGDGDGFGAAADWAGFYASPTSRLSIDHAYVAFAGGVTGVNGGTASFNPIQIHQAEARIANSIFEDNAGGFGATQGNSRRDFAPNGAATIYVTAAQPTIVGNTFIDNGGSAININVNSLTSVFRTDLGRQTGDVDLFEIPPANNGPVLRGNQLEGNDVNGVIVRGEVLLTEVVWDDTDIVHVLANDIEIPDLHHFGGMRLESSATESLVVKASNAEILTSGRSLDIVDRIGGRLLVLGQPGFPVVITSINDSTVGAGFTPSGEAQTETIVADGGPSPGDWVGLRFDALSHDRNVAVTTEREGVITGFGDTNATIGAQQDLGLLAADERSGDENIRLGFTVHGAIAADNDVDLYSFEGVAGTLVWLDIDQTDLRLDTVLELIDGEGRVLALSDSSRFESAAGALTFTNPSLIRPGHALPMQLDHDAAQNATGEYRDLFSTNNGDAGMRVVLPGTTGTRNTFYVRVRSANSSANYTTLAGINASVAAGGETSGGYQLQVRIQEIDEHAGSVVRYADLRYATNAIVAIGLPVHSPITGELFNPGGLLDLGNFSNTDRGAVSVAGNADATPDIYSFNVDRDGLQGLNPTDNNMSIVIDVDWADGLTRPNTNAYLFNGTTLIAIGTDSNVSDDRVTPVIGGQPTTERDPSRGSVGNRDAFIGPLELNPNGDYQVVIVNDGQVIADMEQFFRFDAANKLARLEPLDSIVRIIDDRFDYDPGEGSDQTPVPTDPEGPVALQVGFNDDGSNVLPWQFGDLPLIAIREDANVPGEARISIYNPLTGRHDAVIEDFTTGANLGAVAQDYTGTILGIGNQGNAPVRTDANTSITYTIDAEGNVTQVGATGIQTFEFFRTTGANPANTNRLDDEGIEFVSLAYYSDPSDQDRYLYGVANRGNFAGITVGADMNNNDVVGPGIVNNADNIIYRLDPDTGAAISRRATNMPAAFSSADPLSPRLQDDFNPGANNFNPFFPPETPWAGTNIVPQIQIPFASPVTGGNTGLVTSISVDPANASKLFAFTDQGAVWEVDIVNNAGGLYAAGDLSVPVANGGVPTLLVDPTVPGGTPGVNFISNFAGQPLQFEQVTRGPANFTDVNDTVGIDELFFAVGRPVGQPDAVRNFYAFDLVTRTAQPIFTFGADSVAVGANSAAGEFAGLFFSPLDQTLWHLTDTLREAPGHGFGELDDRPAEIGGGALRFGFDALNDDFNHLSGQDADGQLGGIVSDNSDGNNDLDAVDLQGFSGYNFIGGAHGSIQSNTLDLAGFSSDDLPTLYFTYLLDSENVNADDNAPNFDDAGLDDVMRDSLRVTVAGDDGIWRLVATNNFVDGIDNRVWDDSRGNVHEYDPVGSFGYTDVNDQRFVQELFDDGEFRQARIDLGPWAGQQNVRIRFEFSTAGEARPDQSEIQAIPARNIADGQSFTVTGVMPLATINNQGDVLANQTATFEFDLGLVVQMPSGPQVTAPVSLTRPDGSTIVTLVSTPPTGPNEVQVLPTDTAADVAARVQLFLGGTGVRSTTNLGLLGFTGESAVGNYGFGSLAGQIVSTPGLASATSFAVPIDLSMDEFAVRDAMQASLAQNIRYGDGPISPAAFPIVGDTNAIRFYDLFVSQSQAPGVGGADVLSVPGNDSLATAQDIDNAAFTLTLNTDIQDSQTRPHTTIQGTGDDTYDYFSFTIANAGDVATFDIDGATFDTELHLFDAAGNPLASDDDSGGDPGSSGTGLDSFISHTFAAPGTYIIGVAAFDSAAAPGGIIDGGFTPTSTIPTGGQYTMHVSIDGKAVSGGSVKQPGLPLTLINGELNGPTNIPGSQFGVYSGGTGLGALLRAGERSRGLGGENGVYIDDIVIGLADRGESFTGSSQGINLVDNPFFEALFFDALSGTVRPVVEEIESGPYQLEVRLGREYLGDDNTGKDARIGVNERLADGLNLVGVSSGAQIVDGDTFTLSNGFETLRFEFNDVTISSLITAASPGNVVIDFTVADTVGEISQRIRNTINSDSVRSVLGVQATTGSGQTSDITDPVTLIHGYLAASVLGGVDFTSLESGRAHFLGQITGGDIVLGEDNGDRNLRRDQGVFIVDSNTISFSENIAIDIAAGEVGPNNTVPNEGDRPKPGAVQNLPSRSSEELVHGAVVQNNLLISNGNGIRLAGNPELGGPFVYSRILNNTIFNSNVGIDIVDQAAPTLLNNVLIDNNIGLRGIGEGPTVIRATVFSGNGINNLGIGVGTEVIINPAGPLFVNPSDANFGLSAGRPNFYPAAGSVLIDSSIESQLDRASIVSVKESIGIPQSPIVVTNRDLAGQLRADGSTASGQGNNVNIDRGALDRSDNVGPTATIIVPGDNDTDGIDVDPTDTFLQLREGVFSFFEILVNDGSGMGPDASTITPDQIELFENGRLLVEGVDYTLAYNVGNRTLRFTPAAGIWRPDAVYEIVMRNEVLTLPDSTTLNPVADLAGNTLQPNRADGQTRFTIVMPQVELDFGDSRDQFGAGSYETLFEQNGARHALVNFASPRLGDYVDGEVNFDGVNDSDDLPSVLVIDGNIREAGDGPFTVTPGAPATVALSSMPAAGDNISVTAGSETVTFELVQAGGSVAVGRVPVEFPAGSTVEEITALLAATMEVELLARNVQAIVQYVDGTAELTLVGQDDEDGLFIGSVQVTDLSGAVVGTVDGVFLDPENGEVFSFLNPLAPGGSTLFLDVIGSGFLDAWVDFNGDGDFNDAGEQILDSVGVVDGQNEVTVFTPATGTVADGPTQAGITRARFRLSTDGGLSPRGLAVDGEVEDYDVVVAQAALPVADNDSYTFNEDTLLNQVGAGLGVAVGDVDAGVTNIQYELVDDVQFGTLTFDADTGEFTYIGFEDFYGTDTFTYRIRGLQSVAGVQYPVRSEIATVTLKVTPVNDVPLALDQAYVTLEPTETAPNPPLQITRDQLLTGALPQDDALLRVSPFDELEQNLTVIQITVTDASGAPAGVVTIDPATPFTPTDGVYTSDTFISDNAGGFVQSGTVTVTVAGGEIVTVDYLASENYNEDNPTAAGLPSLDQFVYTIADDGMTTLPDGTLASPQPAPETFDATVTIQVRAQNDAPVANADTIPSIGLAPGPVEDVDFAIPLSFLIANDTAGPVANGGTIGAGDENSVGAANDGAVSVITGLLPDGITTAFPLTTAAGATVSFDSASGSLIYSPAADYYGSDSFVYTIVDQGFDVALDGTRTLNPKFATATVSLTVAPINDAPSTTDKTFTTDEDTPITITRDDLIAGSLGDADANQGAPQDEANEVFNIVAVSAGGTVVNPANPTGNTPRGSIVANFDANGFLIDLVYTPNLDLNATDFPNADGSPVLDTFGFTLADDGIAIDPDGGPDIQTPPETVEAVATITVTSINDVPLLDALADLSIDEDSPLQTVALTGILPGGNEPQDLRITSTSSNLDLVADPVVTYTSANNFGSISFTPVADRYGVSTITVTVEDAGLDNDFATADDNLSVTRMFVLTVDPVNDDPSAFDQSFETIEDTAITITAGELIGLAAGDADPLAPTAPEDESNQVIRVFSLDIDGTIVTAANVVAGQAYPTATGSIVPNFVGGFLEDLVYTPNQDSNADNPQVGGLRRLDTFGFTLQDDGIAILPQGGPDVQNPLATASAVAGILVRPTNDAPEANGDLISSTGTDWVNFFTSLTLAVPAPTEDVSLDIPRAFLIGNDGSGPLATAGDENGLINDVELTIVQQPIFTAAGGQVIFLPNGDLRYLPPAEFHGTDSFTYTVRDQGIDEDLAGNQTVSVLESTATVLIEVEEFNDPPLLDAIEDVVIPEDTPSRIVPLTGIFAGGGESQVLEVTTTSSNPTLINAPVVTYTSDETFGSIDLVPNLDQTGMAEIVVTVQDGGLDNDLSTLGDNQTVSRTFTLTVTAVNDVPIAGVDVVDAAGTDWMNFFTGQGQAVPTPTEDTTLVIPQAFLLGNDFNARSTATDELSGQNDGDLIILQQPITTSLGGTIDFLANGNLLYTPPTDAFGLDTFEYTITDDGVQEDENLNRIVTPLTATTQVTINVQPVNDVPTLAQPGGITMLEDTIRPGILTGISAGGGESQTLSVTATSSNPAVLPDPVINYTSPNDNATFNLIPNPDASGISVVTVVVTDAGLDNDLSTLDDNLSVTRTFIVRVNPVNDVPTIDAINDVTITEDAVGETVDITGITAGFGENQELRVTATSGDSALLADPVVTYVSPETQATLALLPGPDQFGSTTVTVTIIDGGADGLLSTTADNLSTTQTFVVTIDPDNDAPTLDPIADLSIGEDAGQQTVSLAGISPGPLETQVVQVVATSDNPGLIANPVVQYTDPSATGTLTFTSVADQFGTATITVAVTDGGADNDLATTGDNLTTMQTFVVTVGAENDAPSIDPVANVTIPEDSPVQTVNLSGINAGGGENQPIRITASSDNTVLISDVTVNRNSGSPTAALTFTPVADQFGIATISIVLEDGGLDQNLTTTDDNGFTTETFVVNVTAVNDAPTLDPIADLEVAEDAGSTTVDLTGITNGPSESGPLRVTAVSDNPTLVPGLAINYASPATTGTLNLITAADTIGTATITVTVEDAGVDGDFATTADNLTTFQTFSVTVDGVNDDPTIDPIAPLTIAEEAPVQTVDLTGISAGGGEIQPLRVTATSDNPTLVPDPTVVYTSPDATGTIQFAPAVDQFGSATITVTVEDGGLDGDLATTDDNSTVSQTFVVTVDNVNDAPTAVDDNIVTDEDEVLQIDESFLLANDTDPDFGAPGGQTLSIIVADSFTSTLGAAITFDAATGELVYDPTGSAALQELAPGETLEDTFTYELTDGSVQDPAPVGTVTLTISGVNDAPTVVDDVIPAPASASVTEPIIIRPLRNDFDIDGTLDPNSVVITLDPQFGSLARQINADGEFELAYSPFDNFTGQDFFRYTVSDNLGQASGQATVFIAPSELPITGADVAGGVPGDSINVDVLANDFPVVGSLDVSTLAIVTDPENGVATVQPDGTITYVANDGFFGVDSFQYTITDTEGNTSDPQTVQVNVVESGLQNPILFGDVNANGEVTSLDALLIINLLGRNGNQASIPVGPDDRGPNFFDVNGNLSITALDALQVINRIGTAAPILAEGEQITAGGDLLGQPIIADLAAFRSSAIDLDSNASGSGESTITSSGRKVDGSGDQYGDDSFLDDDLVDLLVSDNGGDDDDDDDDSDVFDLALRQLI